jgi:isocitrate/isopropylmalate dehydrogenase
VKVVSARARFAAWWWPDYLRLVQDGLMSFVQPLKRCQMVWQAKAVDLSRNFDVVVVRHNVRGRFSEKEGEDGAGHMAVEDIRLNPGEP